MEEQCSSQNTATTSGNAAAGNESGSNGEAESEDGDDSSSLSSQIVSTENDLEEFRRQWQSELVSSTYANLRNKNFAGHGCHEIQIEEQARDLYLQGVEAERNGRLYEAIVFYRRAVQLVPDIEFRVTDFIPKYKKKHVGQLSDEDSDIDEDIQDDKYLKEDEKINDNSNEHFQDLTHHFNKLCSKNAKLCQPAYDLVSSHISVLPREILIYICKWVVSCDLDMRSLEQLSLVCRGFYLCSRDAELWRLSCMRIWGVNCGSPNKYGTWRDMFIKRPRLQYNGAYISKTTYLRPGEPGFQDHTYRPWHIVDYYRYLRFFPEGIVLMMTTPEEPLSSLSKLRHRGSKHPTILSGHYHLHGNMISATLQRTKSSDTPISTPRFRRLRQQQQQQDLGEQAFHLDLEVMGYKNKSNYKLEWRRYSIHTVYRNGQESISDFALSHAKFPSFWFSRVKSYTAVSEKPL